MWRPQLMHAFIILGIILGFKSCITEKKIAAETHLTIISTIFVGEGLHLITGLVIQDFGSIEHCKLCFKIYQCTLSVSTHISCFSFSLVIQFRIFLPFLIIKSGKKRQIVLQALFIANLLSSQLFIDHSINWKERLRKFKSQLKFRYCQTI